MTWFTKLSFFSAMFLFTVVASAQRFTFDDGATSATVKTQVIANRHAPPSIDLHLNVPQLDVDAVQDGFKKVLAPGLVPINEAGKPELYTTGSLIAIPAGYEPELKIEEATITEIPNVKVRPFQQRFRCDCPENNLFTFDSALYMNRGQSLFPKENIKLEQVGTLGGMRLARVAFYPVQMDMQKQALKVTTRATLRVSFKQTHASPNVRLNRIQWNLIRNTTANGREMGTDFMKVNHQEAMLIVVADSFKSSIQPLVQWKRARGMKVDVVTYSDAGGSKEGVRNYVANYYKSSELKPSYLLFVGNKNSLPAFSKNTSAGNAYSDYTYALLDGSEIPTVAYGRLAADNESELNTQINRLIAYEKNPEVNAPWYSTGTTIASNQGYSPSDKEYAEQIQANLKKYSYTNVDGFYQGEQSATFKNIANALNDGRTWLTYFGHGSGTSWGSVNDHFQNSDIPELANNGRLPFVIDVACENASWVVIGQCFGKAWVTGEKNGDAIGAVAYLGGSVNISWHPPAIMSVGISKYHFEKPVETLGGSIMAGQLYLIEQQGNTSDTIDNIKWYNLLGDPSLIMRTATPKAYELKHTVRSTGNGTEITVAALDEKGNGVKGVLVSIHNEDGNPLAVNRTDDSGNATILIAGNYPVTDNQSSKLLLTASGYNLETHEIVVQ